MTYVTVPTKYGILNIEMDEKIGNEPAPFLRVQARKSDGGLSLSDGRTYITTEGRSVEWWVYRGIILRNAQAANNFPLRATTRTDGKKGHAVLSLTYSVEAQEFDEAVLEAYLSGIAGVPDDASLVTEAFQERQARIGKIRHLKTLEEEITKASEAYGKEFTEKYSFLYPERQRTKYTPPYNSFAEVKLY